MRIVCNIDESVNGYAGSLEAGSTTVAAAVTVVAVIATAVEVSVTVVEVITTTVEVTVTTVAVTATTVTVISTVVKVIATAVKVIATTVAAVVTAVKVSATSVMVTTTEVSNAPGGLRGLVRTQSRPVRFFSRPSSETAWSFALPRPDFVAGSYQGRTFLSPSNHLGEDSEHAHHDSVHAIADGIVRESCTATGYGRVVVIEHRLPDGSNVCSIYGHLCGHRGFPLARAGSLVKKGDVVGYIGDRYENGDGLEHLHLGIRKGLYDGYFCGYARLPYCTPKHYHPPTRFIRARSGVMRLASRIESFPTSPGDRNLTFKASVLNGFFDGGEFEFRLQVSSRFTSEIQKRKLAPGASASLLFPTDLPDSRTPSAVVELRAPGTEGWCVVEVDLS